MVNKEMKMTKSKKHSPQHSETDSILGQVPNDKMQDLIQGLAELMREKKRASSTGKRNSTSDQVIMDETTPSLEPWKSRP